MDSIRQGLSSDKTVHALLIVLLSVVIYGNCLGNGFVGDDRQFVVENRWIRDLGNLPSFFFSTRATASGSTDWGAVIYRPLRTLSYAVDYRLFGLDNRGFHATNVLLHILVCISFYFILRELFVVAAAAFAGALLFAVHPVHQEAVAWVAGRADLIGMLFFNLSLWSYIRYRQGGRLPLLLLSLFLSFAAYLGKETMVCLPGIILAYDLAVCRKAPLRKTVPARFPAWTLFLIVCAAYLALRFSVTGRMSQDQSWWGGSVYSNFLMMTKATAVYMRLLVFPFKLNLHYLIEPVNSALDPAVALSLLLIAGTLAATVYFYRKNDMLFFFFAWFFLALVPIANIVPISFAMMAERYIYMPSAGPIAAMALGVAGIKRQTGRGGGRIALAIVGILTVAFSLQVIARNRVYRDEFTFYSAAVKESPGSAPSHNGLASQYAARKEYSPAIENFDKAISLDPRYAEAYILRASVYAEMKNFPAAVSSGEKAVSLSPGSASIRYSMGNIYREAGDLINARTQWEKAVELDPLFSAAWNNLGNYFFVTGDYEKAAGMYEQGLRSDPDNAETHYNIARVYEIRNNRPQALLHYRRFIELSGPGYEEVTASIRKKFPELSATRR